MPLSYLKEKEVTPSVHRSMYYLPLQAYAKYRIEILHWEETSYLFRRPVSSHLSQTPITTKQASLKATTISAKIFVMAKKNWYLLLVTRIYLMKIIKKHQPSWDY